MVPEHVLEREKVEHEASVPGLYTVHIGGDDGGNDGGAIGGPEPMQMQTWVDEHCTVARSALRLRSPPETEQPGGTAKLYPILKRPRSPCAGWPQAASTATQQQSALRYPRPLPKQERPRTSQRSNGNSAWTRRRRQQQQRRWRWEPARSHLVGTWWVRYSLARDRGLGAQARSRRTNLPSVTFCTPSSLFGAILFSYI